MQGWFTVENKGSIKMNFQKRIMSAVLAVMMLCSLCVSSVLSGEINDKQNNSEMKVVYVRD